MSCTAGTDLRIICIDVDGHFHRQCLELGDSYSVLDKLGLSASMLPKYSSYSEGLVLYRSTFVE